LSSDGGPGLRWGRFAFLLKRVKRKIANQRKGSGYGERSVEDGGFRLRPSEWSALQEAAVAEDAIRGGEGEQRRDECVEVHRFSEASVK
jgi:hypothetical protein